MTELFASIFVSVSILAVAWSMYLRSHHLYPTSRDVQRWSKGKGQ
jgi:hypothetical protein